MQSLLIAHHQDVMQVHLRLINVPEIFQHEGMAGEDLSPSAGHHG